MVQKEISLAVHCLTVAWPDTILFTYREERFHFSKG